jgi:hypothetical protein
MNATTIATLRKRLAAKDRELVKLRTLLREAGVHIPTGRPLAATLAQQAGVRNLRRAGLSLRKIAKATDLSLSTVVTIVRRHSNPSGED